MENTLNRQQRRMIRKMNKKNPNRKIIPMITEFGKKVVNPHFLPSLNHPTKVFITVDNSDNEIQKLLNGNNGGVIMDFIDNNNHKDNWDYKNQKNVDKTSIIKWDEKYYEWESGKEIVIINNK